MNNRFNPSLFKLAIAELQKCSFVPMPGGQAPIEGDPAAQGGDPSQMAAQGGMPPGGVDPSQMDPAALAQMVGSVPQPASGMIEGGGAPISLQGMPQDPSMVAGIPPIDPGALAGGDAGGGSPDIKKQIHEALVENGVVKAPKVKPEQQFAHIQSVLEAICSALGIQCPPMPVAETGAKGEGSSGGSSNSGVSSDKKASATQPPARSENPDPPLPDPGFDPMVNRERFRKEFRAPYRHINEPVRDSLNALLGSAHSPLLKAIPGSGAITDTVNYLGGWPYNKFDSGFEVFPGRESATYRVGGLTGLPGYAHGLLTGESTDYVIPSMYFNSAKGLAARAANTQDYLNLVRNEYRGHPEQNYNEINGIKYRDESYADPGKNINSLDRLGKVTPGVGPLLRGTASLAKTLYNAPGAWAHMRNNASQRALNNYRRYEGPSQ